jgi:hypothetical protein
MSKRQKEATLSLKGRNQPAATGAPASQQYKMNPFITFAFEQGYYRTRAANRSALDFGGLPLFRGIPSYTSHNLRSEFATIFTF